MFRRFSPPSHKWPNTDRGRNALRLLCFSGPVTCWQAGVSMPIAERTSASALTTVNFCAVSHVWEAMQHPDPWGFQLAQLAEKLGKRIGNGVTWVFLDYVSLFQFRRTPEEDHWFYKALDRMHILYSHEAVEVTLLVDLTPEHLKSASEVLAFCEADSLVVLMSIASQFALKFHTIPPTWMVPSWEAVGTSTRITSCRMCSFESPSLPPIHAGVALYPPESWHGKGESKRNLKSIWVLDPSLKGGRFILEEVSAFFQVYVGNKISSNVNLDLTPGTMRQWCTSSKRKSSRWKLQLQHIFSWRSLTVWHWSTCGRLCLTTPGWHTSRWMGPHSRTKTQ